MLYISCLLLSNTPNIKAIHSNLKSKNMKQTLKVFLTALFTFSITVVYAQDTIHTVDGREIKANVLEITENSVRYRLFNQPDGPIRNILFEFIDFINYRDGSVERFDHNHQPSAVVRPASQIYQEQSSIISADREALAYVTRRLERSRSVANFGLICAVGAVVVMVGDLIGGMRVHDAVGEAIYFPVITTLGLGGLGMRYFGVLRAVHFYERKQEIERRLSNASLFIIPPNNTLSLHPKGEQFWGMGVRIHF